MVESIRDQVVTAIHTALLAMTIANGYHYDYNVYREVAVSRDDANLPAVHVVIGGGDGNDSPNGFWTETLAVEIELLHKHHGSEPKDRLRDRMVSDAMKALAAGGIVDGTLGQLQKAQYRWFPVELDTVGEIGVQIDLSLVFAASLSDPTSQQVN